MATIVVGLKHGRDDPDRASLGLVVASSAIVSGQDTVLYLSAEGVRLALPGYAAGVQERRFLPLTTLLASFVEGGGAVWVCANSLRQRGLTADNLIAGAIVAEATELARLLLSGAAYFAY